MRLIDADKVKAKSREHCKTCTLNGTKQCKTCVINLICDRLDLQPTIQEVPHDDLISRSALKKEVENLVAGGAEGLKDYYENGSKSDENSWIGGVYDAWELIGDAPTVTDSSLEIAQKSVELGRRLGRTEERVESKTSQGEWFPVSEELPNISDRFLVTTRYGEVMTDYFTGHHFLQGEDIIAWQPLPEAYKEGGTE